jgi:hypothetical protein
MCLQLDITLDVCFAAIDGIYGRSMGPRVKEAALKEACLSVELVLGSSSRVAKEIIDVQSITLELRRRRGH